MAGIKSGNENLKKGKHKFTPDKNNFREQSDKGF